MSSPSKSCAGLRTSWPIWLVALTFGFGARAAAQEPEPDAAVTESVPTPQEPAPTGYVGVRELDQRMRTLGAQELGRTAADRPIWLASFGNTDAPGRPAILIVANLEGDRLVATELALDLCEHFAAGSPLLDSAAVHILPSANPDAMAAVLAGLAPHRGRPIDDDHDGRTDEDPADDLDGDGRVLQLRIPDPAGEWMVDEDDPRVMRKADRAAGERGTHRIEAEGHDEDGDRRNGEDGPGGVALDANFPHRWRAHRSESSLFQLSERASRTIADFVLANPRLALVIVLDDEDNLASPPKGASRSDADSTEPRKDDAALLSLWSERLYAEVENKPRSADHGYGNFADWVYFQLGVPVIESSVWSIPLDTKDADGESGGSDEVKMLRWADQHLTEAFHPWTAVPANFDGDASVADGDTGAEIGGWLPLVQHNPPASELEAIGQRYRSFLDGMSEDFAQLSTKLRRDERGGGIVAIELDVTNHGLLATMAEMGAATRRHVPVRAILELPEGGTLLSGRRLQALPRLEGLGGSTTLRWLIQLPDDSQATVRLMSRTAGETLVEL
jgi:Zinc carboxypeptidase